MRLFASSVSTPFAKRQHPPIRWLIPPPKNTCFLLGDNGVLIDGERSLLSLEREHSPRGLYQTQLSGANMQLFSSEAMLALWPVITKDQPSQADDF